MQKPDNLKITFFGNTKYSTIIAKSILGKFGLSLVVTILDRPSGRHKHKLIPNPVKLFAIENKIPIVEADRLDKKAIDEIAQTQPDFLTVSDFGLILPTDLLKLPKYAPLNVHHSLLPKYRGPAPAPYAILNGDKKSGVTIISMTEDVDTGDLVAQQEYSLKPNETTDSLLTELNTIGGKLVIRVIENFLTGSVKTQKQNGSKATYTKRFKKEDGRINLLNPPSSQKLNRMIRAFYPWPGVWTILRPNRASDGRALRIKLLPNLPTILPSHNPTDPFLIQPEGKKPITIKNFSNGYPDLFNQIEKLF